MDLSDIFDADLHEKRNSILVEGAIVTIIGGAIMFGVPLGIFHNIHFIRNVFLGTFGILWAITVGERIYLNNRKFTVGKNASYGRLI